MRRARWIITPKLESPKPVIYHCIGRAVNREFVFGDLEREHQRMFMRTVIWDSHIVENNL